MNHLINSLKVEMQCPDEGVAFTVRHQFAQYMQAEMIEAMDDVLNKYSVENEWIRINKLEIDIGKFSNATFDKNFKQVFAKQFEQLLLDKINSIPQAEKGDVQINSLADAVRHFLLNGLLPWWVNKSEFDLNDAVSNFFTKQDDVAKLFFVQQQNNQLLWQRVALQLNNEAKEIVIQYFLALQTAQKILPAIWKSILQSINKTELDDSILKQDAINNFILKIAPILLDEPINEQFILHVLLKNISEIISQNNIGFNEIIAEINNRIINENISAEILKKVKSIQQNNDVELNNIKQKNEANEIEKYLVQQAGIVLLSPFFKPFFNNLKLLENGKWLSKEAQIKAVHLLYFISTGSTEAIEYNVTIEKVLCGLPILFPIPLEANLTVEEMEECNAVITSTIEHWSVLKSTSVQGFRQTFLQREGILKPLESSWLLQIERKTLDVLLEKIPWGFNTIFLPWLNKLINVEW